MCTTVIFKNIRRVIWILNAIYVEIELNKYAYVRICYVPIGTFNLQQCKSSLERKYIDLPFLVNRMSI